MFTDQFVQVLVAAVKEMVKNQKEHLEQMAEGQKRFFDQMLKVRKAEKKES